jgi:Protein of unknown function (DUF2752)
MKRMIRKYSISKYGVDSCPTAQRPMVGTGWAWRFCAGLVAIVCLTVLVAAACIKPDPAGLGTHKQLGQPECGFYERTGFPCPTCGMTTAFAYMVRGKFLNSFSVQPAGAMAALLCLIMVPAGGYVALGGQRLDNIFQLAGIHCMSLFYLAGAIVLLSWGWLYLLTYLKA